MIHKSRQVRIGKFTGFLRALAVLASIATVPLAVAAEPGSWLAFRGDGTSAGTTGPSELGLGEEGNLSWKSAMPGRSVAGPVVVGDRVITTSSGGQEGEILYVTAVSLSDGEKLWEQSFRATGRPFCHPTSANAAPSPACDGERVFAFFSSNDLICLSVEGDLLWYRGLGHDYPKAGNDIGMASSPVVANGAVIVQIEAQGDSFALGIDAESGKNLWKIDRPRLANWSSPVAVMRPDDSTEVVMQCGKNIMGVDPRTGNEKWLIEEGCDTVSSSTPLGGLLLVPGGELMALDIGSSATTPEIAWQKNRVSPSNASPVAGDNRFYSLKGSVLIAANAEDGEIVWQQRLSGVRNSWATPVTAGNRVYLFDQSGVGLVVEDEGDSATIVSEIDLEEAVLGSPAITAGKLIVRGADTLFCFE